MDKLLILRKLTELDTYLQQIGEYQAISVDEYRGDWRLEDTKNHRAHASDDDRIMCRYC